MVFWDEFYLNSIWLRVWYFFEYITIINLFLLDIKYHSSIGHFYSPNGKLEIRFENFVRGH